MDYFVGALVGLVAWSFFGLFLSTLSENAWWERFWARVFLLSFLFLLAVVAFLNAMN